MPADLFQYTLRIENFNQVLGWLMVLCGLVTLLTAWMMASVSRFFLTQTGQSFSILSLQLPWSFQQLQSLVGALPPKTKTAIRWQLGIDYWFMPFFYGLLFFANLYLERSYPALQPTFLAGTLFQWLPMMAWLMDILENKLIVKTLDEPTKTEYYFLLTLASLKWGLILFFIVASVLRFL